MGNRLLELLAAAKDVKSHKEMSHGADWRDPLNPAVAEYLGTVQDRMQNPLERFSQTLNKTLNLPPNELAMIVANTGAGSGINAVKGILPKTEFELAHEIAQRNATLPVEQGGLGLHPDNTAMDRAKAMGFDTPVYHGTGLQPNFDDPSGARLPPDFRTYAETADAIPTRSALFSSTNPDVASGYAEVRPESQMIPLLIKQGKQAWNDAKGANWLDYFKHKGMPEANARTARNAEYDTYKIKNVIDNARAIDAENAAHTADTIAVINPSNMRSKFAAFDPMQRNSSNILAQLAVPVTGASLLPEVLNQYDWGSK